MSVSVPSDLCAQDDFLPPQGSYLSATESLSTLQDTVEKASPWSCCFEPLLCTWQLLPSSMAD